MAEVTTPIYKYLFTRSVSTSPIGELVDELPGMYGVSMTKFLSKPGNLTASIRLDHPSRTAAEILEATRPQERTIWVYRNDKVVWAGIVWSRTYQSDAKVITITARTYDSWLHHLVFDALTWSVTNYPPNLIIDIWNICRTTGNHVNAAGVGSIPAEWFMQGYPGSYSAGQLALNTNGGSTGIKVQSWIDAAIKAGAEYRVLCQGDSGFTSTGRVNFLQVGEVDYGYNVGMDLDESPLVYQFPGSIKKYFWPESASEGSDTAMRITGKGKPATGSIVTMQGYSQLPANDSRWYEKVVTSAFVTLDNASTQADVTAQFYDVVNRFRSPAIRPTFELNIGHSEVDIYDIDVGDYFRYILNDPLRFPTPRLGAARVSGWVLAPPRKDEPEQFGITVDDRLSTQLSGGD